ncbi:MAG: hypothetical protein LQ350_000583 [Teloschistes chrysophthalmus]|nr:MAG: hypothetical protein LQ350_000583 [Niorma chrysophthalma]
MRSSNHDGVNWDFAPVFDLISSLSSAPEPYATEDQSASPSPERITTPTYSPDRRVTGSDLGNFDKVWTFLGQPLDVEPPEVPADLAHEDLDENTKLRLTISKGVHWRDETEGGELADNEEAENDLALAGLTKAQRKKYRRRQRKAATEKEAKIGITPTSSSENDSEVEPRTRKRSPDRKAIIQQILKRSPNPVAEKPVALAEVKTRPPLPLDAGAWPIAKPHLARSSPKPALATNAAALALEEAAKRKERLMKKLKERFIADRAFLTGISMIPSMVTDNTGTKEGIHVFVDASNIMIGFHDTLKISRGLGLQSRLRRQPLSFHNLSLILERGRPVSKRVLVGSDTHPSIVEARLIGYETNILDRVHKAKELTPRQKRYHSSSCGGGGGNGTTSGGSGSETTAVYAKEKWVEQAVDEILHLKILESIVDAASPSTMVLATGDAAEAEYSQGFLRMAERALEKGWRVELVSFSKNMSGMYKRKGFREKWGQRFEIVELDDFVEELLGFEP